MKELIRIFQNNKADILEQLLNEIKSKKIIEMENDKLNDAFLHFSALETVYAVDEKFVQLSPIFHRNNEDVMQTSKVKTSLRENVHLGEDDNFISAPYVSEKSNKYVVTLVKKMNDRLMAFDFDLYKLLKEMKHTALSAKLFLNGSKIIYGVIGISLTLFSLILIFYAIYDFSNQLFVSEANIFQLIFKSTIGLTLGLAIFDLAKNLLEHEVVFKEEFHEAHGGNQLLMKFFISIMIALAIESLMMVFKIALKSEYHETLYAVALILAIGFMLIAMSQFNKHISNKRSETERSESKQ